MSAGATALGRPKPLTPIVVAPKKSRPLHQQLQLQLQLWSPRQLLLPYRQPWLPYRQPWLPYRQPWLLQLRPPS